MREKARADGIDLHVGRQLRLLRTARGISQAALAAIAGVSYQQLRKYEIGTDRISASRLYRLALALDVDLAAFFTGLPQPGGKAAKRRTVVPMH